jgi:hypothetical protein
LNSDYGKAIKPGAAPVFLTTGAGFHIPEGGIEMKENIWIVLALVLGIACSMPFGPSPALADEGLEAMRGQVYYLACNLHADPGKNTLSSINYQVDGGLIPWGTEMKVVGTGRGGVKLEDVKSQRIYQYQFHKRTAEAIPHVDHLKKILIKDLAGLKKEVNSLPALDQQGIKEGRVKKGMTRKGTLIAIGPPPEFATPNPMKDDAWNYWYNKWKQFVVRFDGKGKVESLHGYPF